MHATSHALQPMHTDVSVKKPTRSCCSSSLQPSGRRRLEARSCASHAPRAPRGAVARVRLLAQLGDELGSASPRGRRPGRMPHVAAFDLLDVHVRVERHVQQVVRAVAGRQQPRLPQWYGRPTWCVVRPCTVSGRIRSVTSTRASIAERARVDRRPAAVLEPDLRARAPARPRRTSPAAARRGTAPSATCRPRCGARSAGTSSARTGRPPRPARPRPGCTDPGRRPRSAGGAGSRAASRAGCRTATRAARSASAAARPRAPAGRRASERPSACMMNGWSPAIASSAFGVVGRHVVRRLRLLEVGHVEARPLLRRPTRRSCLRSDHGLPSGSAEARL